MTIYFLVVVSERRDVLCFGDIAAVLAAVLLVAVKFAVCFPFDYPLIIMLTGGRD